MLINATQFVERSQFFNGQRLFASDLQELEAFNREMRWLHNQSLHQPGIGSGYVPTGKKGAREVTIGPGYALDAWGREIVLTQTRTEPVPPVADDGDGQPVWYDLTVSYPSDSDLKASETREGICLPRGVVRLREEPVFCWVRLSQDENGQVQPQDERLKQEVRDGTKLVVARAEVFNCQLKRDLCTAQRRNVRPATQPYIACGRSTPTPWEVWRINGKLVGFQASIDTTNARFRVTPHYEARLEDAKPVLTVPDEVISLTRGRFVLQVEKPSAREFVIKAFYPPLLTAILGTTATPSSSKNELKSFLKDFAAAKEADDDPDVESGVARIREYWQVVWFGIES